MQFTIILIGSLPLPPITGGIANGINMMLNSDLSKKYNFVFINRAQLDLKNQNCAKKFLHQLDILKKLVVVITKTKPVLVHIKTSSYLNFFKSSIYLLVSKILGIKTILQIHGGGFESWYNNSGILQKAIIRFIINLSDKIFVLSGYWKQFLSLLVNEQKIAVIPNGVKLIDKKHLKKRKQWVNHSKMRTEIFFLGSPKKQANIDKGFNDILKAFQLVFQKDKTATLVLAGFKENYDSLMLDECFVKNNPAKNIKHLGLIEGQRKIEAFCECDIFVLPSYCENMPNSILEAMAAELPIISTAVGAIPELIEEGINGFLVKPGDYMELAKKILILVNNPILRLRMGKNNVEKIQNYYDFGYVEHKIDEQYYDMIQS